MDYSLYFRRIRASHRMTKHDVVACCALGGIEITVSRAEGWNRNDERRHTAMTAAEFDAFTAGLPQWARENYTED